MENSGGPLSAAPASVIFAGLCCSIYLNGAGLPLYLSLFVPLLLVAAWICGGDSLYLRRMASCLCRGAVFDVFVFRCFAAEDELFTFSAGNTHS